MKDKVTQTTTLEQALDADLVQDIRNFINELPEAEMIGRYFALLSCLQSQTNGFFSALDENALTEEEQRNMERELQTTEFKVQCFQERFPQFKGTRRVLSFCPGYGIRERIVSDDPGFTPIWGDFPPARFGMGADAGSIPPDKINPS